MHTANAQAPGYLGKRFYAKIEGMASLSFGPTSKNNGASQTYYDYESGGFGADTRYGLSAGYAISRHQALAFSVSHLKTGLLCENLYFERDFFYQLKGNTLSLGYLWFKTEKGAIAPYGTYGGLHLQKSFLNGKFDNTINGTTQSPTNPKAAAIDPKTTYWSVGLEFGHNAIIKDKIVLNYAFHVNLPLLKLPFLVNWMDDISNANREGSLEEQNKSGFETSAKERMITHNLFGVKLGIGLLAF
ncbi:MAG: hypothetical protein IT258_23720 [Saprospiraceae bacterium]|nr:hypothetical protein [Saprospiraceae bacterium]